MSTNYAHHNLLLASYIVLNLAFTLKDRRRSLVILITSDKINVGSRLLNTLTILSRAIERFDSTSRGEPPARPGSVNASDE